MIAVAYAAIALGVLAFVFKPFFYSLGRIELPSRGQTRRRELLEQRERIYEAISELDFDYRVGKVEEDDYQQTRNRYEEEAIAVLKAIDRSGGPGEHVKDPIEEEIASRRRSRKGMKQTEQACPSCGSESPLEARFCPQCGASLNRG